jgi:hypothetical protein
MGKDMHGANGKDVVLKVPVGTQVYEEDGETLLTDLTQAGEREPSFGRIARLVIAAMLAFGVLCQGITAPFEKDEESRPAGLIRDIVQHGNWLVPCDDYREPSRKPPLYYWLSAIAAKASGGVVDETRARAIAVAAAVAVAVAVMAFGGAFLGEAGGWLAFLFLLAPFALRSYHKQELRADAAGAKRGIRSWLSFGREKDGGGIRP